jgi:hypothetical protein
VCQLGPWHDGALRQWLDHYQLPTEREVREKITGATGNWPLLLYRFHQRTEGHRRRWEPGLNDFILEFSVEQHCRNASARLDWTWRVRGKFCRTWQS